MTTQTLRTSSHLVQARDVAGIEPRQLEARLAPDHRFAADGVECHRVSELFERFQRIGVVCVRESVWVAERHGLLTCQLADTPRTVLELVSLLVASQPRQHRM